MNGIDEYYTAPDEQLEDDELLGGGPVTATGDDVAELDIAELPF